MDQPNLLELKDRQRRKQLRLNLRADLQITPSAYEGRTFFMVKDPVSLQYYRFREQEHFILQLMDGKTTLEEAQKQYEKKFRPERVQLEDLEQFAQQIINVGLARNESPQLGSHLLERRGKRLRREWGQRLMNVLAIRIPAFDPDWVLTRMLPYFRWMFTPGYAIVSSLIMLAALLLVGTHFEQFRTRMPDYKEFLSPKNLLTMWATLGLVKIIHEFGHGLSCKAFGGECHEMGLLLLCFSPSLYCNVSDAWMLPSKWRRILISFAGIYIELMVAAIATFVWWNSSEGGYVEHLSLSLMVVCSISTVVFNGNPLLRYDGYYVMSDLLEIPNLSQRANEYLMRLAKEHCLGIEVEPERYMVTGRKILFVVYAIASYVYRWIVTFGIVWFFYNVLKPYKLGVVGGAIGVSALGSMLGMPLYQLYESVKKRGRLPDMQSWRVVVTSLVVAALVAAFFLLPLPVGRVRQTGMLQVQPEAVTYVHVAVPGVGDRTPGILEKLNVIDGQVVPVGYVLAQFRNLEVETQLAEAETQLAQERVKLQASIDLLNTTKDENEQNKMRGEIGRSRGEGARLADRVASLLRIKESLVLRAPRSGVVMSPPRTDQVNSEWDKEKTTPFCGIGNPTRLRVLVPISPAEYRVLKEDLHEARSKGKDLDVDLRLQGRGSHVWNGTISYLPESDAREIPIPLSNQAGGPIGARTQPPGGGGGPKPTNGNVFPQTQQYLISVNVNNPDDAMCQGMMSQVKIHTRWHTVAWWSWRTLSTTFDLML